jgi:DNA-directed RNA polymerase specialized sigma24 family protein
LLEQQHGNETNETLQQLRHSTILTDSDWEYFRDLFEKAHPGFLQRLKEKIPGLTPAETRFIVLSKLELSGKEMAAMLGIGTDAIRQLRSRVKKKLNLQEESSLDDIVNHI